MKPQTTSAVRIRRTWCAAACAIASACAASFALAQQAPCSYSVVKVGAPVCSFGGPTSLYPFGINSSGHWVGYRGDCANISDYYAVRWTPQEGLVPLPLPPDTEISSGAGINDRGTVIGIARNLATIWRGDELIQIPPIGSGWSYAAAVNNSDVVVGARHWTNARGQTRILPFIWEEGAITDLEVSRLGFQSGEAWCISNSGIVAGDVFTGQLTHGFRWQDGTLELLVPLAGMDRSEVRGVTDAGVAVGNSILTDQQGNNAFFLPTIWEADGIPQSLPLLPGYAEGGCNAVSASGGVVLGSNYDPTGQSLPINPYVVWIDRVPYPIAPRIASAGANSFLPYRMNDIGQIVGRGGVSPPGGPGVWIITPHVQPGDLNGDCMVNGLDLAALLDAWGPAAVHEPSDFNSDGKVNGADLGVLLGNWSTES